MLKVKIQQQRRIKQEDTPMCTAIIKSCSCGGQVSLHHVNSYLPEEAVVAVYCPDCEDDVVLDEATMVEDNGWVIEYDMDIVAYHLAQHGIDPSGITPQKVFDESYSTWNGLTPTDSYDKAMELHEIMSRTGSDKRRYFEEIKEWTKSRTERLAEEGWRKAKLAV
jgi:hypothetical protein